MHNSCSLLMHASLAVTTDGLPLGLAVIKFRTRAGFKGTNALKRRVIPTRVPIEAKESIRWLGNMRQATALLGDPARLVHIDDRESASRSWWPRAGRAHPQGDRKQRLGPHGRPESQAIVHPARKGL
jgi:hypothetical protein